MPASENSDSERNFTMEKVQSCYRCGIGFKRVGFLSPEERLEIHEQTPHSIKCDECEDSFISDAHLKYHIETHHDIRCADCCSFCNKKCSIKYAMKTKLTSERTMEEGITERRNAVAAAVGYLEECVKKKTQYHTTLVADMARLVDAGFDGPEAIHWSRLIYLPLPKISERTVSNKVKKWVQFSEFEVALDEQIEKIKNIAVKRCPIQRCNLSFIDEWTHRWDFHPDSSNRHWAPGPEPLKFLETNGQTMPLAESSGLRYQIAQVRDTEEYTETDNLELVMKKQEKSSDPLHMKEPEQKLLKFGETIRRTMPLVESSSLRYQDAQVRDTEEETETDNLELVMKKQEESSDLLHMKEPEPKLLTTIGQTMPLAELKQNLRYQNDQVRNTEEEKETNNLELVMKKQEESSGSLSMKELTTKLVMKKQKEPSDTLSMKELEKDEA